MDSDKVSELANAVQERQKWFAYFVKQTLLAFGLVLSKEDIEDILSDSFLKASTKLLHDKSLEIQNYYAWFAKIVYYTSLNAHKKELIKNSKLSKIDISELEDYYYVHNFMNESNNKELVQKVLNILDKKEEQIILMSIIDGLSSKEIAEKMNIDQAATVRKIKSRAIKKLRNKII